MERDTDFQVGDLVRIRSWEDMENEFGLDEDGDIVCVFGFTPNMGRLLCGKEFIITQTDGGEYYGLLEAEERFSISSDMLEKVDIPEINESKELNVFLDSINIK